ncbi:MAG: response regulator [Candidatus Krumholzibacteriota bacterium]|nr:response regulator [Candidatus Krumholzibacteriota bacterium]
MKHRIICVDDEPNILSAYKRQLKGKYEIETALGAQEALGKIEKSAPFALVISDLRMPQINGIQFLTMVKTRSPESVRVMITGNADLETAMAAVNKGSIFRILTKPVDPWVLNKTIEAAIEQHQLIVAEKELLEDTLNGSIRVLTEMLSIINPMAFSSASRIKGYASFLAGKLEVADRWQIELAAMLSHIGCVTLHPDTLEKIYAESELTRDEKEAFESHPETGCNLLINIPRMETVARIIKDQLRPFSQMGSVDDPKLRDQVEAGAQILGVAIEFDRWIMRGVSKKATIARLKTKPERFDPVIVAALEGIETAQSTCEIKTIEINKLITGMILDQDVRTKKDLLLVAKGQEVTASVITKLHRFVIMSDIDEKIRVMIPKYDEKIAVPV